FGSEQRLEERHFLGIKTDRGEAGGVRALREPVIVRRKSAPLALERRVVRAHGIERGSLGFQLLALRGVARVERDEPGPGAFNELAEPLAIASAGGELLVELGVVLSREPAAHAFILDRDRERFIENRVVGSVRDLV